MFRRFAFSLALGLALIFVAGCGHKKVVNPIANLNSKQPDKVLFDRSMEAMKKGKYDVARITLQTLINTYPDSEYVARAKLAVGDSWYAEGGATGLQQAEIEYKDFITFFPNMPEAAEAQLKVANIHYRQMEKPDRDFTHAKRAEDEYRTLIQQWPDSKLVAEAKARLLEVQEVLAEREYRIGRYYFLRESWAAAIARLKSVTDTYPLYSKADDALMMLAGAYERQIDTVRETKLNETQKGEMINKLKAHAAEAYDKVITRYPVGGEADRARERLEALHMPVPKPTPEAIAQNKAEEESRGQTGRFGKLMGNFHKAPDMAATAKVGEPVMTDPKQTGAPEIVAQTQAEMVAAVVGAQPATPNANGTAPATSSATAPATGSGTPSATGSVEVVNPGSTPPPPNAAPPISAPKPQQPDNSGIQDLATTPGAVVDPNAAAPAAAPPAAAPATPPSTTPTEVNDAKTPAADAASSANTDSSKDSSSVKKKKKKNKKNDGQK